MNSAKGSDVRGPVAMIVSSSSTSSMTSSLKIVTKGWLRKKSVMAFEKPSRSTAKALPAGTRCSSAKRMIKLSTIRSSCFKTPTAFKSVSLRNEFEHTNSANADVLCAGVIFLGRISYRCTGMPRLTSCHVASHPAKPAPITLTALCFVILFGFLLDVFTLWIA